MELKYVTIDDGFVTTGACVFDDVAKLTVAELQTMSAEIDSVETRVLEEFATAQESALAEFAGGREKVRNELQRRAAELQEALKNTGAVTAATPSAPAANKRGRKSKEEKERLEAEKAAKEAAAASKETIVTVDQKSPNGRAMTLDELAADA